jgi:hypothetical protein
VARQLELVFGPVLEAPVEVSILDCPEHVVRDFEVDVVRDGLDRKIKIALNRRIGKQRGLLASLVGAGRGYARGGPGLLVHSGPGAH